MNKKSKNNESKTINNSNKYLFLMFFVTIFIGIGYASINSIALDIDGLASANAQPGLFITSVSYVDSSSSINQNNSVITSYDKLFLNSSITLNNNSNSYITYSLSVINTTNDNYTFVGVLYDQSDQTVYSNNHMQITYNTSAYSILSAHGSATIQLTFKYVDNYTPSSNEVLDSFIKLNFKKNYSLTYNNTLVTNELVETYGMNLTFLTSDGNHPAGTTNKSFNNNNLLLNYYVSSIPTTVTEANSSGSYSSPTYSIQTISNDVVLSSSTSSGSTDPYIYVTNVGQYVLHGNPIPEGIDIYYTPEDAMDAFGRPFCFKHLLVNNVVTESYLVFLVTREMVAV